MEKMEKCMDNMMDALKRQVGPDVFDMDAEEFETAKSAIDMMETAREFMLEQAATIQEINEKLDKLLATE
jgi:hypothetical protein